MTEDRWQKLRDLGCEVITDREGESLVLFGFRRIPAPDESREDAASSEHPEPSEREAPRLTPEQQAAKMRAMYDPTNAIDASAWLGRVRRDD